MILSAIILTILGLTCSIIEGKLTGNKKINNERYKFNSNNSWHNVVMLPDDYRGDDPPENDGAVKVSIELEILRDLMVDEMQGEITIDSFLTTRWRDSRLRINENAFKNLEIKDQVNVSPRIEKRIWKPDIVFVPMEKIVLTKGMKPVKLLAVSKNGTLTYKIGCTITLLCAMEFSKFPFDVQECKWEIYSFRYSQQFVNLTWGPKPLSFRANLENDEQMKKQPQFGMRFITDSDKAGVSEEKANKLTLKILLHRDIRSHVLVTYLPSALFVSVSWGSFLVSPEAVPGRMVLLVTTLLTLVTMLNTVRCGAPPTNVDIPQASIKFKQTTPESEEIKPVEIWIDTCIGFVVMALFEYFVVLYVLRCRTTWQPISDEENARGNHSWLPYCLRTKPGAFDMLSLILFPLSFFLFNIVYWIQNISEMDMHFRNNFNVITQLK